MAGIVKRKYTSETRRIQSSLTKKLNLISKALPIEYNTKTLLALFKDFFPLEWEYIVERYKLYSSKDEFLIKQGKRQRYYHKKPEFFFLSLQKVKHMTSDHYKTKHKENFKEDEFKAAYESLSINAKNKKLNHQKKQAEINNSLQITEPLYLDIFINSYHNRGTTTEDKVEIFNELKKYKTQETIIFFQKLNDSERNDQIRQMAFSHLQKLGKPVRLRKKFKGKTKSYQTETNSFNVSPEDLRARIESDSIQNKKSFHAFISHSFLDSALANILKSKLNEMNLTVYCDWLSDNDFLKRELAGKHTEVVLKKRIEQSKIVIFIATENSINPDMTIKSPWVEMEINHSILLKKPILKLEIGKYTTHLKSTDHTLRNEEIDAKILEFIEAIKSAE